MKSREFRKGDKVKMKSDCSGALEGKIYTLVQPKGSHIYTTDAKRVKMLCSCKENWELVTKNKNMNKTKSTTKAKWKVGDRVVNDDEGQRSEVIASHWDEEYEEHCYFVKCLDDTGSIHSVLESCTSSPTITKMTLEEVKAYYFEQEQEELEIIK